MSSQQDLINGQKILQIVRNSSEATALSDGFMQTLSDGENKTLVTVKLKDGEKLTGALLRKLLLKEKPAVLIVWDNAEALPSFDSLLKNAYKPKMLFISSSYIGEKIWSLKESLRSFSYLTYPYAFTPYNPKLLMGRPVIQPDLKNSLQESEVQFKEDIRKTENLTIALTQVLTSLLMDMRGSYIRDNFLDVAGMMMDQQYPLYGKISFGATERYTSKGCYIVQLSQGDKPELVKKSDWIIH